MQDVPFEGWDVAYCPFCVASITYDRVLTIGAWQELVAAVEELWQEHLSEHVDEMMAV